MTIRYSVIIPTYNEGKNIFLLYKKLIQVMNSIHEEYEVVFIDDGSTDDTYKKLEILHKKNKRIKVIKFRRNFGQTASLNAGFHFASGEVIIVMDADLQNDPKDIPRLIARIDEGYDVVSGWRFERRDKIGKRLSSKFSNWLGRKLTGLNIHDSGCSLKAYKRECLLGLKLYGEMHRYVPAIVAAKGYRVGEVKVSHQPRKHGMTKYGSSRLIKGFLDLLYIKFWSKYSSRPLHFFGTIGFILFLIGVIIAFEKLIIEFLYLGLPFEVGPMLLLSVLCIVTAIQFLIFGFLGEILIRTYYERAGETPYNIEKKLF